MKKILSFTLASIMLLSMSANVFAAEKTTSTLVKYDVANSYEVTIPAEIEIRVDGTGEGNIIVGENFLIPADSELNIRVSSNDYIDKWELVDVTNEKNKLTYIITTATNTSGVENNGLVLSVPADGIEDEPIVQSMGFRVIDKLSASGNYHDTLTFEISIEEAGSGDVLEGNGAVYNPANPSNLTFRIDRNHNDFERLLIYDDTGAYDGTEVNPTNYTVTEGSTIIDIKASYLASLNSGNYTFEAVFANNDSAFVTAKIAMTATISHSALPGGSVDITFVNGMTWKQWVESDLNTYGFSIRENGFGNMVVVLPNPAYCVISLNSGPVNVNAFVSNLPYTAMKVESGTETDVITYVDGEAYTMEYGMTWRQFASRHSYAFKVNSSNNAIALADNDIVYIWDENKVHVGPDDIVIPGHYYGLD